MLNRKEKKIVHACADAFFPPDGPIPISGSQAALVPYFDSYLQRLPRIRGFLGRLLLLFIQLSPWIFGPRRVRFTHLLPHERTRLLEDMSNSTWYFRRIAALSMRTMLTLGYFAHPRVLEYIKPSHKGKVSE